MNSELYRKLKLIPIVLIIVSIFVIGVNLIKNNEKSFINTTDKSEVISDLSYNKEKADSVINLNSASFKELCKLPGVGSEIAERILEYRIDTGGFTEERELLLIEGISEDLFEGLLPYVIADDIK